MKTVIAFATVAMAAAASAQSGTLDQHSPFEGTSFALHSPALTWQAQIRAGIDGQFEGIQIEARGAAGAEVFVRVRDGGAWATGPALFETLVRKDTFEPEIIFVDMAGAGIMLSAGDLFVIETQGNETGMTLRGSLRDPPAYEEPLFLNMSPYTDARIGFKTYMIEEVVDLCADCDESGELDFFDFLCFQNQFAAGDPEADCDESGSLDFFDFLCFQDEFAMGCP